MLRKCYLHTESDDITAELNVGPKKMEENSAKITLQGKLHCQVRTSGDRERKHVKCSEIGNWAKLGISPVAKSTNSLFNKCPNT